MSGSNLRKQERGFIALMSVLIIGAMITTLVFTLGASTFFSRFNTLEYEYKRQSVALAESCVNATFLKIAQNGSYQPASGGDCVSVEGKCPLGKRVCKICQLTYNSVAASVATRARYGGAYTNLVVTFSTSTGRYAITKREEVANNTVPLCTLP